MADYPQNSARAGSPMLLVLQLVVKRILDIAIAALALIGLAPLLLLVWLGLERSGPALLRTRVRARGGGSFSMLAFRTRDANGEPAGAVGRFVERAGLARLPALFNILAGDMALAGPPPAPLTEPGFAEEPAPFEAAPGAGDTAFEPRPGLIAGGADYAARFSLLGDFGIIARRLGGREAAPPGDRPPR